MQKYELISKMQSRSIKNFIIFILLTVNIGVAEAADNATEALVKADTLFSQKHYTQALNIYDSLQKAGHYTPQSLLKSAYIYEGAKKFPEALYYLSLYSAYNPSEPILAKLESLAAAQNIEGYETGDEDLFNTYYLQFHHIALYIVLGIGTVLILAMVLRILLFKKAFTLTIPIVLVLVFVFLIFLSNYQPSVNRATITTAATVTLEGPSAGAEPVNRLIRGTRVKLLDQLDSWYHISIGDETGYIKKSHARLIQ